MKRTFTLKFGSASVKLKVFASMRSFREAYVREFGDAPDLDAILAVTRQPRKGRRGIAMWFTAEALSITLIAHEAVHAAYAIGRSGVNPWERNFEADEEERLAYPTGEITGTVCRTLTEAGWLLAP